MIQMPEIPEGMLEILDDIARVLVGFENEAIGNLMDATAASRELGADMGQGMASVGLVWHIAALGLGWSDRERELLLDLLAATYARHLGAAGMTPDDLRANGV